MNQLGRASMAYKVLRPGTIKGAVIGLAPADAMTLLNRCGARDRVLRRCRHLRRLPLHRLVSCAKGVSFSIPPAKLIHIGIDPHEIGKNYPAEVGIVADAQRAVAAIVGHGVPTGRRHGSGEA
ncbi:hypothetical protein [Streptomyces botrytidirepellens]|uniref:hypothetical protein n=1 Tax=Streptomyces botrytidirepellens TaxID=2486417 RepID=UPI001FE7F570|nr:hypothetical protein [Streptomyces botrytidirepellens]